VSLEDQAPGSVRAAAGPRRGAAAAVVAAGLAFLLLRPSLPGGAAALAAGYLLLAAAASGFPEPVSARAPLGAAPALVVGVAAVATARLLALPAPPPARTAAAVGLGLLAAVAEEALFRRLLYGRLEQRLGPAAAVLGSAVLFALVHLPAYGTAALPVDLGAGLLLSWQRHACGRWEVPAATHAVANLLAVI
jgi:membrane protease YdiL (CAAX protease family)